MSFPSLSNGFRDNRPLPEGMTYSSELTRHILSKGPLHTVEYENGDRARIFEYNYVEYAHGTSKLHQVYAVITGPLKWADEKYEDYTGISPTPSGSSGGDVADGPSEANGYNDDRNTPAGMHSGHIRELGAIGSKTYANGDKVTFYQYDYLEYVSGGRTYSMFIKTEPPMEWADHKNAEITGKKPDALTTSPATDDGDTPKSTTPDNGDKGSPSQPDNPSLPDADGDLLIRGSTGDDRLTGGDKDDVLFGGGNIVVQNDGDDLIIGNKGSDLIFGNSGNDIIWGDQRDLNSGQDGDDNIFGGLGEDTIYGGNGNDILAGGGGIAHPADEADVIYGGHGADILIGNGSDDKLYAGTGDSSSPIDVHTDMLFGGLGNDRLYGDSGADILAGQFGNDTISGGNGEDIFIYGPNEGSDVILDFNTNMDTLYIGIGNGIEDFEDLHLHVENQSTVISLGDTGDTITLQGVTGLLNSSNVVVTDLSDFYNDLVNSYHAGSIDFPL